MSVRTLSRVWEHSQHGGTGLLMLLAIADFSDDEGRAYPSVSTLAKKCRMQPRNAQTLLAELRASGELEVRINAGPKGCNQYRVVLPGPLQALAPLQKLAPLQSLARGGAKPCAKPLQSLAPEPSLNRQEPNTRTRRAPSASDLSALLPGVDLQTLKDWEQVRKAKRAGPVTATAAKLLHKEAEKAGMTTQQAVETCCHRGWQSFKAEWVAGQQSAQHRATAPVALLNADEQLRA